MCCGKTPLTYQISTYQSTPNFGDQLQALKNTNKLQNQFTKKISFTYLLSCTGNNPSSSYLLNSNRSNEKCQFSIDFNEVLKQVTIENEKKGNQFWYSVEDNFVLTKGDTVRVGTASLEVHDIYSTAELKLQRKRIKQAQNQRNNESGKQGIKVAKQTAKQAEKQKSYSYSQQKSCRICFNSQQQYSPQNPLLSLCKCSGSVKYMHYECYREWYQSKVKFYNERKITYFQIKNVRCELCKHQIPFAVEDKGRRYCFLDYRELSHKYENSPSNNLQMMNFPELSSQLSNSFISENNQQLIAENHNFHNNFMVEQALQQQIQFSQFSSYASDQSIFRMNSVQNQQNVHGLRNVLYMGQQQHANNKGKKEKEGMYIVLKSEKIVHNENDDDESIIQVIRIKLELDYQVTFGNQSGISNVIIKNAQTSSLHMSLQIVNDNIVISNHSEELGTFIKMRDNQAYQFIGKDGCVIDCVGKKLVKLKNKNWKVMQFLEPNIKYRVQLADLSIKMKK